MWLWQRECGGQNRGPKGLIINCSTFIIIKTTYLSTTMLIKWFLITMQEIHPNTQAGQVNPDRWPPHYRSFTSKWKPTYQTPMLLLRWSPNRSPWCILIYNLYNNIDNHQQHQFKHPFCKFGAGVLNISNTGPNTTGLLIENQGGQVNPDSKERFILALYSPISPPAWETSRSLAYMANLVNKLNLLFHIICIYSPQFYMIEMKTSLS